MIDAVTPDHPVFIDRLDGHMALANSLAMRLAGVTKDTKEIEKILCALCVFVIQSNSLRLGGIAWVAPSSR